MIKSPINQKISALVAAGCGLKVGLANGSHLEFGPPMGNDQINEPRTGGFGVVSFSARFGRGGPHFCAVSFASWHLKFECYWPGSLPLSREHD